MNCADLQEQLVETARGRELSSDVRGRVFAHASSCTDCARRLEVQSRLSAALSDLSLHAPPAPERVEQFIMRQLPVPILTGRKQSAWRWRSLAAAAAIAAFGVSAYVEQQPWVNRSQPAAVNAQAAADDEFIALPYAAALTADDSTSIVRLEISRGSLLTVGFPVGGDNPDEVLQADVVLGPDGTPRAIRLAN